MTVFRGKSSSRDITFCLVHRLKPSATNTVAMFSRGTLCNVKIASFDGHSMLPAEHLSKRTGPTPFSRIANCDKCREARAQLPNAFSEPFLIWLSVSFPFVTGSL